MAVNDKFSYGWSELEQLGTLIPKLINVKGYCKIGVLRNRHILIRFNLIEDFVNIMAKSVDNITAKDGYSYQMSPLIYDANFSTTKETFQAMA